MIEEQLNQILNELGDGSYILVAKVKQDGGITSMIRWKALSEALIISLLEKTKHDLLTEINKRQTMIKDETKN